MSKGNKIRIAKSPTIYTIEVNDKGDTITIDLTDIDQMSRFNTAYGELEKVQNGIKGISPSTPEDSPQEIQASTSELINQLLRGYELIDLMFGEGSVEKIFGGHKTIDGFFQFFEQMTPHIEKARQSLEEVSEGLTKKYEAHGGTQGLSNGDSPEVLK